MRIVLYLGSTCILTLLAHAPASGAETSSVAEGMGHDLARRLCTTCHLIEPGQANPPGHVGGPAFQTVANTPNVTEKSLRKHLRTTHSNTMIPLEMPNPGLSEDETVKLVDYIISLSPKP